MSNFKSDAEARAEAQMLKDEKKLEALRKELAPNIRRKLAGRISCNGKQCMMGRFIINKEEMNKEALIKRFEPKKKVSGQ